MKLLSVSMFEKVLHGERNKWQDLRIETYNHAVQELSDTRVKHLPMYRSANSMEKQLECFCVGSNTTTLLHCLGSRETFTCAAEIKYN